MLLQNHLLQASVCILLIWVTQATGQRGDVAPSENSAESQQSCNCNGSIAASVIITTIVVLILAALWWCYCSNRKKKNEVKPDPEAASRAAYDNPLFQGDDSDQTEKTTHGNQPETANVASTATNTTSTLERGKNTLERVISAVIRGSRSRFDKKSKDDHNLGVKQLVTVPLEGHDFTGLGFTIHGNISKGLFIKDVMSRGPASQSGQIVPGDKVVAITVLTDHIVYEDALAILSYASPYPVIVNLEKGCGPISGFSTLNAKNRLNTSTASVSLIHPSFKTQSCADLNKIKSIDISRLKLGNILPMVPKGKIASVNITQEIPKLQKSNLLQRSSLERHSERAIDVPGVDVRIKSSDIILDIDQNATDEKTELANVQVHRPMVSSSSTKVDSVHTTIEMPKFRDSELSAATEKLDVRTNTSAKFTKFGVKVFPDMNFISKSNKNIDMETGEIEMKKTELSKAKVAVKCEHEKKKKIEEQSSLVDFDNRGRKLNLKKKDSESSGDESTRKKSKNDFGLGIKDLTKDAKSPGTVEISSVEVPLPTLEINLKKQEKSNDQKTSEKEVTQMKKSKNSFKIGMPDMPTFGMRSGGKQDKDSSNIENEEEKVKSKSKSFKFGLPSFDLSSKESKVSSNISPNEEATVKSQTMETDKKDDIDIEAITKADGDESKSKYDLKFKAPSFNLPIFGFKSKDKNPDEILNQDETGKNIESSDEVKKSAPDCDSKVALETKTDIDVPDVKLPKKADSKDDEKDNEGEEPTTKSTKKGFSINAPDIKLKLKMKKSTDSAEEGDGQKKSSSRTGFKIEAPDINLPSFGLKKRKSKDYTIEDASTLEGPDRYIDIIATSASEGEKGDVKPGTKISMPNIELSEKMSKGELKSTDSNDEDNKHKKDEDNEIKREKKKSKEKSGGFNFKFKGGDFSFPTFGGKSSKDDKIAMEISAPTVEEKTNIDLDMKPGNNDSKLKIGDAEKKVSELESEIVQSKSISGSINDAIEIPVTEVVEVNSKYDGINQSENTFKSDLKIVGLKDKESTEISDNIVNLDKEILLDIDSPSAIPDLILGNTESSIKSDLDQEFNTPYIDKDLEIDNSISDEVKVEVTRREFGNLELQTDAPSNYLIEEQITESKEIKIPQIVSPDLGFEDDKSKNGKHEREGSSDCEMSIKLPELSHHKWSIKSNSSYDENSLTSKNVSLDSNLPDIDSELIDDESSEDLNITDATKKKRFGYKIRSPDILMPDFLNSPQIADETDENFIDGNQSDEMKSLSLKLKAPNASEGAIGFSSESPNDFSDEALLKLPRIKVSSKKSSKSHTNEVQLEDTSKQLKFNKSDEWKMHGTKMDMDLASKLYPGADDVPEDERENRFNIDIDDADFVIPDINSIPEYDINNPLDFNLISTPFEGNNVRATNSSVEYTLPDLDIKQRRKIFENAEDDVDTSQLPTKEYLPNFQIDVAKSRFLNLSLESSELESDLPEADSDLKKSSASSGFPSNETSISNVKLETIDQALPQSSFGNAFGFRGFKKHIARNELQDREYCSISSYDDEIEENNSYSINNELEQLLVEDLPEADIHLGLEAQPEIPPASIGKSDIELLPDIIKLEYKLENEFPLGSESSDEALVENISSKSKSEKLDIEKEGKSKAKMGLGFGFKGFGRSESEENDSNIKVSQESEGINKEEKSHAKAKKSFSFKNLVGRSSSDTEEDNNDKVSENPKIEEQEEKEKLKLRNKSSLTFGFKQNRSRSSDSEENYEIEKVESNPQTEGQSKKQKGKSNLSFGFSKPKTSETEVVETVVSSKMTAPRENKHDNKSESEGGEDERLAIDSKTEEGRAKSRYGLNFGFKKNSAKTSSDSEGMDNDENEINLDERGATDKSKEQKSKSLKIGFKGLKNLKGKIQNEFNKMRHDSPSSEDDDKNDDHPHGEKRKKLPKKKDKDKKMKRESEGYIDASEEAALTSAGLAAKESRRKRIGSKRSSSSSSSSCSSSDEEEKVVGVKKKKKIKNKRKEEFRVSVTNTANIRSSSRTSEPMEVIEKEFSSEKSVDVQFPRLTSSDSVQVTVGENSLEYNDNIESKSNVDDKSSPRTFVVVREMKLKKNLVHPTTEEVNEVIEKVARQKKLLQTTQSQSGIDAEGTNWTSDSDMENKQAIEHPSEASVNLIINKKHRELLTDSEELKRKTASLGDLSTLHECAGIGTLLERAVSLDLKDASVGHPSLHIRRLQLPDSSATSIDEADEPLSSSSPKKNESNFGLKAASQWGTLEEALRLGIRSNEYLSQSTAVVQTIDERGPVSNIEISGDPSLTTFNVAKNDWNDSFEDENGPPSLPLSPAPSTTINMKETKDKVTTDSSIVVVGNENLEHSNGIQKINVMDDHMTDDSSLVTITTVPAVSHVNIVSSATSNLKAGINSASESIPYNNVNDASIVTVSHDMRHENGEIASDHNISDEYIIPDSSLKSMTQITLEGDGGYTVTEGAISRTVILTGPEASESSVTVQTEGDASIQLEEFT